MPPLSAYFSTPLLRDAARRATFTPMPSSFFLIIIRYAAEIFPLMPIIAAMPLLPRHAATTPAFAILRRRCCYVTPRYAYAIRSAALRYVMAARYAKH